MSRKRKSKSNNPDGRHANPGRPRSGDADVLHKVYVSRDADRLVRHAAEREGLSLSQWWRRAMTSELEDSAREPERSC